jgi:hypothetical protein
MFPCMIETLKNVFKLRLEIAFNVPKVTKVHYTHQGIVESWFGY